MEKQTLLQTEQLSVGYQGKALIENIGISLQKGEIVTLIGQGAGKSTILKSIAKQLPCIRGSVYVEQALLQTLPEKELAKKMSIVFTERITPEYMTVEDVVAMGRYPYTGGLGLLTEEDREIVSQCMKQIRIEDLRDRNFMSLSDGQRQRVMLAKALCQEPEILVLDEPTSYLDVKYKLEFLAMLQELTRKKKLGVLMSLHELDLAERVSDWIVCVKGDTVEHYGTPEKVFVDGFVNELYGITDGTFCREGRQRGVEKMRGDAGSICHSWKWNRKLLFPEVTEKRNPVFRWNFRKTGSGLPDGGSTCSTCHCRGSL